MNISRKKTKLNIDSIKKLFLCVYSDKEWEYWRCSHSLQWPFFTKENQAFCSAHSFKQYISDIWTGFLIYCCETMVINFADFKPSWTWNSSGKISHELVSLFCYLEMSAWSGSNCTENKQWRHSNTFGRSNSTQIIIYSFKLILFHSFWFHGFVCGFCYQFCCKHSK